MLSASKLQILDQEELVDLIECYNDYVMDFDCEDAGPFEPVCVYEFYENEFQEIKNKRMQVYYQPFDGNELRNGKGETIGVQAVEMQKIQSTKGN